MIEWLRRRLAHEWVWRQLKTLRTIREHEREQMRHMAIALRAYEDQLGPILNFRCGSVPTEDLLYIPKNMRR